MVRDRGTAFGGELWQIPGGGRCPVAWHEHATGVRLTTVPTWFFLCKGRQR